MTASFNKIQEILQTKGFDLTNADVEEIRILYPDLNLSERVSINDIEEIIEQIQITPRNNEVIEN
jgi:hypothetical protein